MNKQDFYDLIEEAYEILEHASAASEDHRIVAALEGLDELLAEIDDE